MVRTGFTRAYGGSLRRIIGSGTRNRFTAFGVGLGVTAVVQSSTATALMTTSFAARELVAVAPALAVMLGADVGTTLVAQVLSFDIGWLSPALILVGVVAFMAGKATRSRDLGRVGIGLGLMLLALKLIVGASAPMREAAALQDVIAGLAGEPLLALLIAGLMTWLAHSSLAVVLLVMSLAAAGVVPLTLAFVLVLGANIGGAVPALLLSQGDIAAARRVPLGNMLFRVFGCILVLPFIDQIAPWIAMAGAEPARQVVNFHTTFNLALALVFLPLVDVMAGLCAMVLKDRSDDENPARPRYLDPAVLDNPSVALACAARETLRMGDTIEAMLRKTLDVFRLDDRKLVNEVEAMDDVVDSLHEAIKLYLAEVSRAVMDEEESRRCVDIITFTTNLEHVGDIVDKNLMELASKKIKNRYSFSEDGMNEIAALHGRVVENLQLGLSVFLGEDVKTARKLLAEKVLVRDLEREAAENHLQRLRSGQMESIETSSLHLDVIRDLKRINSHLTAAAYPVLDAAGELRESRLRRPGKPKVMETGDNQTAADLG